jgi:hypothetical protein
LPAVREAGAETLIIADGFSCREQIEQGTDRKGLHTAQVLQMALRQERTNMTYPEEKYVDKMKLKDAGKNKRVAVTILGISAIVLGTLLIGACTKKK